MCGIAGILNPEFSAKKTIPQVKNMLSCIQYRGPDESGIYASDHLVFGNVRLSIVDIAGGQQPMSSADGKYHIVYNGEIFNYIEIGQELQKLGYHFTTKSDTEVLLNAYIEYGPDCLNKLNGQFAFAIWNNEDRELFLARDRVGIRPLFYSRIKDTFVFGSEIKTILEYPAIKAEIDMISLSQVFTLWTTISPKTIFRNIFELSPGNYMRISNGKTTITPYWKLQFPQKEKGNFAGSFQDAQSELEHLLTDAVKIRLRADVPVAAYLSGGLDSSATTALIKKVAPESLNTFSIGFEEAEFDESNFQREVSRFLKTRHQAFVCTKEDIGRHFADIVWHSEIPVLRSAPVPMFCLSKKVRENNIKVVITGEGADEMLAGYDIFKEGIIRDFWSRQPESALRPLLFNRLYPYLAQFQGRNKAALKLFFGYRLTDTGSPFYSHLLRWHNTSGLHNYFNDEIRSSIHEYDYLHELSGILPDGFNRYSRLSKSQWLEIVLFMSGYLLSSQGDRVAMANSVEGRYPFLDYRVIEFAASLPPDYKMSGLNEKYILKKMMTGKIPDCVTKRPKQAYRAPMASGFFSVTGNEYIPGIIDTKGLNETGIFKPESVNRLISKTKSGALVTETENMALAGIISTQILIHQYILKDKFRPEARELTNCKVYYENE